MKSESNFRPLRRAGKLCDNGNRRRGLLTSIGKTGAAALSAEGARVESDESTSSAEVIALRKVAARVMSRAAAANARDLQFSGRFECIENYTEVRGEDARPFYEALGITGTYASSSSVEIRPTPDGAAVSAAAGDRFRLTVTTGKGETSGSQLTSSKIRKRQLF
jgi:hypothetical protein